ncbi:MAG TPA: phosphoribosylglycinamide formyltransferase [Bacillota bacterium]|nr:phosphoribosylglycinamide formyltransferase [Bacillota bacterium]
MSNVKACVFASGTGSNFEAIMNESDLGCDIVLLVCDQPGAKVIDKAARQDIPTFVFDAKAFDSKADYERKLIQILHEHGVEWIFLAGYMRIVGPTLLQAYEGKIVNIHPSLLPAFPGIDAIGQAYREGVKVTGVTVHFIDEGIDTGPIIAQQAVNVLPDDTIDTLKKRIQQVEHKLYPQVIQQLVKQEVATENK